MCVLVVSFEAFSLVFCISLPRPNVGVISSIFGGSLVDLANSSVYTSECTPTTLCDDSKNVRLQT